MRDCGVQRQREAAIYVLRLVALSALGWLTLLATGCVRPSVSQGRALYAANGCAACHGPDGHGDGPVAAKLPAPPIDFRNVSLFKRGATEEAIAKTLIEGISVEHTTPALVLSHHELLMPKFDHLTETERRSIALYLISMRTEGKQGGLR